MVPSRGENFLIRCHLPYTPQVWESMELDCVRAATSHDTYYVNRIASEYVEGKITVYVDLQPGYYDPYFWQLRARARFEGKLPAMIELEMGTEELRTYLRQSDGDLPVAASQPGPSASAGRRQGWEQATSRLFAEMRRVRLKDLLKVRVSGKSPATTSLCGA